MITRVLLTDDSGSQRKGAGDDAGAGDRLCAGGGARCLTMPRGHVTGTSLFLNTTARYDRRGERAKREGVRLRHIACWKRGIE